MLDSINKRCANAITLINIFFGSLSLVYTLDREFKWAALFIFLAVLMDGLDGRVARKLEISSEMGRELDSLCDLVSFGVAPALLIYTQILYSFLPPLGLMSILVYIICGAFRLARFNVLNIKDSFMGMPITLAGGILALISWFVSFLPPLLLFAVVLTLAILMVSKIQFPKI